MAKYSVNQKTCIGCESCTSLCPELFEMKDGKSKTKKKELKGDEIASAKKAAEVCPSNSIQVVD